jgi:hypothetical protein
VRVEGSRRRFPVQVRVRRVHRVMRRGGRLCREVLGYAGRVRPHRRGHGAGEGPLCARRVARAWLSREQGRRGSRARGIEPCGHEFLARGRWWEAVEGAPRSDQAWARCREGAGRCRRGAPACIRRRGAKAAAMEGPKSVLRATRSFGVATSLRLSEGGMRVTAGTGALAAFGFPTSGAAPERWSGEWWCLSAEVPRWCLSAEASGPAAGAHCWGGAWKGRR